MLCGGGQCTSIPALTTSLSSTRLCFQLSSLKSRKSDSHIHTNYHVNTKFIKIYYKVYEQTA